MRQPVSRDWKTFHVRFLPRLSCPPCCSKKLSRFSFSFGFVHRFSIRVGMPVFISAASQNSGPIAPPYSSAKASTRCTIAFLTTAPGVCSFLRSSGSSLAILLSFLPSGPVRRRFSLCCVCWEPPEVFAPFVVFNVCSKTIQSIPEIHKKRFLWKVDDRNHFLTTALILTRRNRIR